jgi:hypothetical protein
MGPKDFRRLRLMAADADDLQVLSACLQDAVLKVGDLAYLPRERRFAFVANRFLWEAAGAKASGPFWRTRVGAHFDDVNAVSQLHIRAEAKDAVLEILAIGFEPTADGAGVVTMTFSGGGAIRLAVDSVNAELRDLSEPWRTASKPEHRV